MISAETERLRALAHYLGDTGLGLRNHRRGIAIAIDDVAVVDNLDASEGVEAPGVLVLLMS